LHLVDICMEKICSFGKSKGCFSTNWGGATRYLPISILVVCEPSRTTPTYRFQLVAHAFRELIAHCLKMTGGKVVFGDGMTQRLVPVKNTFLALKETSRLAPDPTSRPAGVSDGLIEALNDFFDWSDNNRAENRKKTALLLTQLSGQVRRCPPMWWPTKSLVGWTQTDTSRQWHIAESAPNEMSLWEGCLR
jgi:hypothetical protein